MCSYSGGHDRTGCKQRIYTLPFSVRLKQSSTTCKQTSRSETWGTRLEYKSQLHIPGCTSSLPLMSTNYSSMESGRLNSASCLFWLSFIVWNFHLWPDESFINVEEKQRTWVSVSVSSLCDPRRAPTPPAGLQLNFWTRVEVETTACCCR